MPYIKVTDRRALDSHINAVLGELEFRSWKPGDVNYVITRLLYNWWSYAPKYDTINAIMGVLSCISQEFYRKIASPYEDLKEESNGRIEK